jgi:hypothetical protein
MQSPDGVKGLPLLACPKALEPQSQARYPPQCECARIDQTALRLPGELPRWSNGPLTAQRVSYPKRDYCSDASSQIQRV